MIVHNLLVQLLGVANLVFLPFDGGPRSETVAVVSRCLYIKTKILCACFMIVNNWWAQHLVIPYGLICNTKFMVMNSECVIWTTDDN